MKKLKPFMVLTSSLFAVTLVVPSILVLPFTAEKASGKLGVNVAQAPTKNVAAVPNADSGVEVAVYRFSKGKIEKVQLEDYLVGVVAAEMPADFQEEALKAQALTARTYIVEQMLTKGDHLGLPKGADVGDTELTQAYLSDDQLRRDWGMDYSWKRKKIVDAVRGTSGQILTYNGKPITATFFSTSNGYTENSEDYWPNVFPYLRSVPSPWDKTSPKFKFEKAFTVGDFEAKLGVHIKGNSIGKIVAWTAGKRVAKVDINGKVLTGKEIRDKLDLKSSDFAWVRKGDQIVVTTKGYGHGVGMSQYGANGMAAEGKSYKDIVKYYYQGVEVTSSQSMLAMVSGKK
ncbi:stage II sporulation protein D [Bacillota bacterium Lsc_1132]